MTAVAEHDHWPEQECTSACPDNCPNCGQGWNASEIRDRAIDLLRYVPHHLRNQPSACGLVEDVMAFLAELDATDPEGS